ncbi:MAG: hypothetical protein SPI86_03180 [Treponemataceae bacterium]|nr:hypothetical protein [Spirochaetales bacterium]MDY6030747.1 hypothetical protein [Treponemataceae bacterium]
MKKAKYFLILVTASAIIGMFSGCVDDNGIVETFEWWQWGRISNQRFIKVVNDTSSAITVYFQELAAYKENDSDSELLLNPEKHKFYVNAGQSIWIPNYGPKGFCEPYLQAFVIETSDYIAIGWTNDFIQNTQVGKQAKEKFTSFDDYSVGWLKNGIFYSDLVVDDDGNPIPNTVESFVLTFREGEEKPTWEAKLIQ